jgi:hypothetical protein
MSYSPNITKNTMEVGSKGSFLTLKQAVDWFNANATADMGIDLDGGIHLIADTVTVNNSTYDLKIIGLGTNVTHLNASTGLTGKPMFNFKSNCDLTGVYCNGSTLASYGTLANENCVTYDTTANVYSEITDFIMDTFKIGVADLKGVDTFLFNFIIKNCGIGCQTNYSTAAISTSIDLEVGNFDNCPLGIDLLKATSEKFIIYNLVFNNPTGGMALRYTGGAGNYVYTSPSNIIGCTHNLVGTYFSGFDFTNSRDANIVILNCIGSEDKTPHAKINVVGNATPTSVTTAGAYYKAAFTNGVTYTCKMTLANGKMTFQSDNKRDAFLWISGGIQVNQNSRNPIVCVRKNIFVASVSGNATTVTVTTSTDHELTTGTQVQMLGWTGGTGTWNGVYTITRTGGKTFTYLANGNGTPTGGNTGALISPVSVRCSTANQPYSFAINAYLDGLQKDDYFDLYVSNSSNSEEVTIKDLNWLLNTR